MLILRSNSKTYDIWQNVKLVAMYKECHHAIEPKQGQSNFFEILRGVAI